MVVPSYKYFPVRLSLAFKLFSNTPSIDSRESPLVIISAILVATTDASSVSSPSSSTGETASPPIYGNAISFPMFKPSAPGAYVVVASPILRAISSLTLVNCSIPAEFNTLCAPGALGRKEVLSLAFKLASAATYSGDVFILSSST